MAEIGDLFASVPAKSVLPGERWSVDSRVPAGTVIGSFTGSTEYGLAGSTPDGLIRIVGRPRLGHEPPAPSPAESGGLVVDGRLPLADQRAEIVADPRTGRPVRTEQAGAAAGSLTATFGVPAYRTTLRYDIRYAWSVTRRVLAADH